MIAPVACVDAVAACVLPFCDGMAVEREAVFHLMMSPQSKALRHVFFAERACTKGNTAHALPVVDFYCPGAAHK